MLLRVPQQAPHLIMHVKAIQRGKDPAKGTIASAHKNRALVKVLEEHKPAYHKAVERVRGGQAGKDAEIRAYASHMPDNTQASHTPVKCQLVNCMLQSYRQQSRVSCSPISIGSAEMADSR